jgi:transcriptional regulator with XRE-family HTH domain
MLQQSARIREARRQAGLTQATLASQLGLERRSVSAWERGDASSPAVDHLAGIAKATGASFEWLATGRGPRVAGVRAAALAPDHVARSKSEQRLLLAFRSLSTPAKVPMVELLEARARSR